MEYVKILGGGREVGRSAIYIESSNEGIMLDYGVNFTPQDEPNLPLQVEPKKVRAFLISHAHLDHIGALPLYQISSNIEVYGTEITKELTEVMLRDFLKLSGNKLPFEWVEVRKVVNNFKTLDYDEIEIGSFKVSFSNAGHIPGSSIITVKGAHEIAYTGDINTIDTHLVKAPDLSVLNNVDTLIIEATYGRFNHPERKNVEEEFYEAVLEAVEDGGTVLIPAFSLARSQEILAVLASKDFQYPVYYDGMVREIMEIFMRNNKYINNREILTKVWNEFKYVEGWEVRKKIWRENGVIVASAGMLKGGPALFYFKKIADNKKNAVFLVSYQAENTPGRRLLELGNISEGEPIKARFQIFDFSSHAGRDQLLNIVKNAKNLQKLIIVHASPDNGIYFANYVRERFGIEAIVPENGQEIKL